MRYTSITCTGASGSQNSSVPVEGYIEFVRVRYTNGDALGTIEIADVQSDLEILAITGATDIAAPLRIAAIDEDGAALNGANGRFPVSGYLGVGWAGHAANTEIVVDVWWS